VQKNKLEDKSITTSLLIADSNLVMIEKPEVAESELRQAVRWKVKDSLPFDINNAIVDVFEIPGQKERGRTPLVYVTAAEKEFLKERIKIFAEHNLEIESIDIAELVMRNIAALLPEDPQGVALLKLESNEGLMTLTQGSSLYLARNIDVGYGSLTSTQSKSILGENPAEADGLALEAGMSPDQQRSLDAIVLEVQRSLDYYESHFAKPAINSLVIAPLPHEVPGLVKYLASALGLQVRLLDLNAVLDVQQPISKAQQADCFFAIGAALREPVLAVQQQGRAKGKAA
ncbi:MAG: pilus assembly protein PilM, partial [Gammaproteobacteria bacterium]|nr:pilus assembly protein PilM [Gammaproteobacteria bacterium]